MEMSQREGVYCGSPRHGKYRQRNQILKQVSHNRQHDLVEFILFNEMEIHNLPVQLIVDISSVLSEV